MEPTKVPPWMGGAYQTPLLSKELLAAGGGEGLSQWWASLISCHCSNTLPHNRKGGQEAEAVVQMKDVSIHIGGRTMEKGDKLLQAKLHDYQDKFN